MLSVTSLGKGDFFGGFFESAMRAFVRGSVQRWENNPGSMLIEILIFTAFLCGVGFLIKKVINKLKKNDQGKDNLNDRKI